MVQVQTEHLENHTARLTVEVDAERIEKAMHQAARRIAQKARIRGFRPGKAPYNVVVNLYGREYVLSEALDQVGNEIYQEALEAAEIEPYAPGGLEDVQADGQTLVFVVPKQPSVTLGDYRAIRVEHETPEVTDEMVNETMENIRQNEAVVEPADRPAQMGDQVTFGHLVVTILPKEDAEDEVEEETAVEPAAEEAGAPEASDDAAAAAQADEEAEADADLEDEHDDDYADFDEDVDEDERTIVHEHDFVRVLSDDKRDLFPGFSQQIVGMSAGETKEFFLDVPADDEDEEVAGRTLHAEASIAKVESRTVPEWSDELAKRASKDQFETMLELRMDARKQLQTNIENLAKQQIAEQALDQMVEEAEIHYPAELVHDYVHELLDELDRNMRQQGLTLEDFKRITGRTDEELHEQYEPRAEERARRSLALTEFVRQENLEATPEDIEAEIDHISQRLGGDQASQFRQFLTSDRSRANISNQLATDRALDRLVAIARGEEPSAGVDREAEATRRSAEMAELEALQASENEQPEEQPSEAAPAPAVASAADTEAQAGENNPTE